MCRATHERGRTIELQRSAQVEGEIVASSLRLDDGAVFNGKAQTTKARSSQKLHWPPNSSWRLAYPRTRVLFTVAR